jgi:4-hydroxybenzoate polyprenyltransferase
MKNTFVLAPLVFAKDLTHPSIIMRAVGAFAVFCLLAGAVYTLNDLVDVEADRAHPVKCKRPIASGQVPPNVAKGMLVVLLIVALTGAWLFPWKFGLAATTYFVLNIAYSFRLKKIAYLDVSLLAFFFVLRVMAGGFAIGVEVSHYLLACTALLALFLGFGKRRHELGSSNASKQRAALEAYSPMVLTYALAITGVASVATYFFYSIDARTEAFFDSSYLWLTTIHPLFGVLRFVQLVVSRPRSESPTQEMLRDTPFMLNLVMWAAECVVIVYRLKPS